MDRSIAESDLASVLAGLRERAGLSRRQLDEVSGVSEETVKAIESGRNTRPTPETLRKLAQGLATNRVLDRVDRDAADEIHTRLMLAARYVSPPPAPDADPDPDGLVRRQIERRVGPANADLVETILAQIEGHPAVDQRTVLNVVEALVRTLPPRPGS